MDNGNINMNSATCVSEGELVLIGTDHYKRVGNQLVNVNNPNDTRQMGEGDSLLGTMLETLDILKG